MREFNNTVLQSIQNVIVVSTPPRLTPSGKQSSVCLHCFLRANDAAAAGRNKKQFYSQFNFLARARKRFQLTIIIIIVTGVFFFMRAYKNPFLHGGRNFNYMFTRRSHNKIEFQCAATTEKLYEFYIILLYICG